MIQTWPGYKALRLCYDCHLRSTVDRLLGSTDEHWARIVMNRETRKIVAGLQPSQTEALELSGSGWGTWCYFKDYKAIYFPAYDICESPLRETFDLIIAEQVFEHLLWPYPCRKECTSDATSWWLSSHHNSLFDPYS